MNTLDYKYVNHEYEGFVLEPTVEEVPFRHWSEHLRTFWGWHEKEPNFAISKTDLPSVKQTVSKGLFDAGYTDFANEVMGCSSGKAVSNTVVHQYTEETTLYSTVNSLLRSVHAGENIRKHSLSPWILQLNSALREQNTVDHTVYRGAKMKTSDIAEYTEGRLFHWASFVSTSRCREKAVAIGTNVLFEIEPWGSVSMYGKRNPYDVSALSAYPEEEEAVFPIACTFRVQKISRTSELTEIRVRSIDHY
ncbi:ADP-ribosyltransferase [Leisingera sp. JC11]|uniref:ADP-ribosyltransferase n=1 Tax=Leisingera sp. JC11 TaxID=3042469 RepID=UPI0034528FDC